MSWTVSGAVRQAACLVSVEEPDRSNSAIMHPAMLIGAVETRAQNWCKVSHVSSLNPEPCSQLPQVSLTVREVASLAWEVVTISSQLPVMKLVVCRGTGLAAVSSPCTIPTRTRSSPQQLLGQCCELLVISCAPFSADGRVVVVLRASLRVLTTLLGSAIRVCVCIGELTQQRQVMSLMSKSFSFKLLLLCSKGRLK